MEVLHAQSETNAAQNSAARHCTSTIGSPARNLDGTSSSNAVMTKVGTLGSCLSLVLLLIAALANTPVVASPHDEVARAGEVNVTVKYTGKGEVDSSHRLWVWLFDSPDIGPNAMPVAELSLSKNGDVAAFKAVSAAQVWIAVAYDEKGGFGGSAPPPTGSPVALYGAETGAPTPVTPGDNGTVTVTFSDAFRMQ